MLIRKYRKLLALAAVIMLVAIWFANILVLNCKTYTVSTVEDLPIEHACLVLGASKLLPNGKYNLFYKYRMDATAKVYFAGKCSKIVVSGDNRHKDYNEPEEMKGSLILYGIPAEAIYCDYAGGRTLDSVLRFKYIFGQSSGIVISQEFHNARAIYIAKHNEIRLIGFNAKEVDAYNAFKTKFREIFSRALAVIDVLILHSKPRHYGEKILL